MKNFPSAEWVRSRLGTLNLAQIEQLAEHSSVPTSTIHKIRYGQTLNPGIETCRAIIQAIPALRLRRR